MRHRMGRSRRCWACSCPRPARSKPGGGCSSSIPRPANFARPPNVEIAIEGIVALLRGGASDLSDVTLDMTGIPAFNQRVYEFARTIPRGETRTYAEVASGLRASGAAHSVAQAIARNPFMIIVPCHRVLEAGHYADKISPNGGAISKRRLLSIEGAAARPPARPCSTCCCRLRRRARITKFAG